MKDSHKNINSQFKSYPVDRKKVILAIGLLVLMVMMWVRVFSSKSGPKSAMGADVVYAQTETSNTSKPLQHVEYVKIPFVMGRNDQIRSNFFDISRWPEFSVSTDGTSVKRVVGAENTTAANKQPLLTQLELALDNVDLKAVIAAAEPEAFIDSEIYREGEQLNVVYESSEFALDIVSISSDGVLLRFGDVELVKRIASSSDEAGKK